jgi:hypothetical protein
MINIVYGVACGSANDIRCQVLAKPCVLPDLSEVLANGIVRQNSIRNFHPTNPLLCSSENALVQYVIFPLKLYGLPWFRNLHLRDCLETIEVRSPEDVVGESEGEKVQHWAEGQIVVLFV